MKKFNFEIATWKFRKQKEIKEASENADV